VSALTGQLRSLARRVVRQPDAVSALAEVREMLDTVLRAQEEELQRAAGWGQPAGKPLRGATGGHRGTGSDAAVGGTDAG